MDAEMSLRVDGTDHRLVVDTCTTLLDLLRERLGNMSPNSTAAAVVNAVHHATGVRVRDLPVTLDKLMPGLTRSSRRQR